MTSVFKKLISKELGEHNYNKYFSVCQKSIQSKVFDSRDIYNDIYENLKNMDKSTIEKRQERLNEALYIALRISKTYFISFLFFLGGIFYLLTKEINFYILILSILGMSLCFVIKTYEFLVNKYCFIDAQIVLVYKTVLDYLKTVAKENISTK